MHKQNPLRITKGTYSNRTDPNPYFSITNVHLVDINVFANFDAISSLPIEDIKEKPKHRQMDGKTDEWTDVKTVRSPIQNIIRTPEKFAVITLKFYKVALPQSNETSLFTKRGIKSLATQSIQ